MCLSIPAEIISVNGEEAIVSVEGVKMRISVVLLNGLQAGDFVLVHSGFAIQTIDWQQAQDSLEIIRHMRATPGPESK